VRCYFKEISDILGCVLLSDCLKNAVSPFAILAMAEELRILQEQVARVVCSLDFQHNVGDFLGHVRVMLGVYLNILHAML
jgi:hypothetical protein